MLMGLHSYVDPFAVLVLALVLDGLIGDPPRLYRYITHPVAMMGAFTGWLDRRLNRPDRSDRTRRVRGRVALFIVLGVNAVVT